MNLDFENIDQLFEDSLEGLELTPSAKVKTQVQKKMFWHNTFKSTAFRLSLSAIVLLSAVGIFLLINTEPQVQNPNRALQNKTQNFEQNIEQDLQQNKRANEVENHNYNTERTNSSTTSNQNNNTSIIAENPSEEKRDNTTEYTVNDEDTEIAEPKEAITQNERAVPRQNMLASNIPVPNENNTSRKVEKEVNSAKKPLNKTVYISPSSDKNETTGIDESNVVGNSLDVESGQEGKTTNVQEVADQNKRTRDEAKGTELQNQDVENAKRELDIAEQNTAEENGSKVHPAQNIEESEKGKTRDNIEAIQQYKSKQENIALNKANALLELKEERTSVSLMLPKNNRDLSNIPYPSLNDYPLVDDTVGINIHGEEIILPSDLWTFGIYARPNYAFSKITKANTEGQSLSNINSDALKPASSYGFGLDLSYQFKQLSVGGGVAYGKYTQEFNTLERTLKIQNIDTWTVFSVDNWQVDSVAYVNLDSLLQGDTLMTYITDSINHPTQDSTLATTTDSSWSNQAFLYRNVYQYVEIPLFVEYSFNRSKTWQPFMRAGLVTGIHIKSKGYIVSSEGELRSLEALPFAKINFWAHAGLGMKYNLNRKFSAYALVNYRFNLKAILNNEQYINQYIDNAGLTFGLQYHF